MLIDSDEDISELETESKTFERISEKMEKLGFQEGVAQGRSASLQKGFDLGYSKGFQTGLELGRAQARNRFKINSNPTAVTEIGEHESFEDRITNFNCELCINESNNEFRYDFIKKTFEEMALEEEENKNKLFQLLKDVNL